MKNNILYRILLAIITLAATTAAAQNFDPSDTTTLYPHKGTFYADRFEGRKTASGEIFSQQRFTAAHWKIKLGTLVLVTNQNNGQQDIVKVNDRCPKRGVFDLSRRAARAIGIRGSQPVNVRLLGPEWEAAWQAQDTAATPPPTTPLNHTSTTAQNKSPKQEPQGLFDLYIGTAPTRADAEQMIRQLPEIYQSKVEPTAEYGTDGVSLIIRLGQPYRRVAPLQTSLLKTFPEAALRKTEPNKP